MSDYPRCPDCHQKIINRGAHAERCCGPRQVVAPWPVEPEPECECPPGAWHLRDCLAVYWPDNDGQAA